MKPSIPKGTRDFLPAQVHKRNFIFDTIKAVFQKYGYQPIETPTMESLSTLTGKYGEEGDRLLFKVLNNGDYLKNANDADLVDKNSTKVTSQISKRGLRYDLTVPFARFVVMHQNELQFPFKRYHIQPVWRADRPQKGRYQEFYQCDADVVGSDSLMYEAELVKLFDEVFSNLNLSVIIRVNNRKVLYGLAESHNIEDRFMDMTMAIDKLDKIGEEKVVKEMVNRGIEEVSAKSILKLLNIKNLDALEKEFANATVGLEGIAELREFHRYLDSINIQNRVEFSIDLARGLNYYTGCIFEVEADTSVYPSLKMGSIGGGGRYADLTGVFGMKDMPGVGISFGAERIYDVMEEEDLFPENVSGDLTVLITTFDEKCHKYAFRVLNQLRNENIISDLYPSPDKMKKQMKYANARKVPFVIVIGSDEMDSGRLTFKDMVSGTQEKLEVEQIIKRLS